MKAARWWQPHDHTLADSTYTPLRSIYHCYLPGNFLLTEAANQSFGIAYVNLRISLFKSSLLGNPLLCRGSHIFIQKPSSSWKTNGQCLCCMTMPGPIPAVKTQTICNYFLTYSFQKCNTGFCIFFSLLTIHFWRGMRSEGHVAHIWKMRNAYKTVAKRPYKNHEIKSHRRGGGDAYVSPTQELFWPVDLSSGYNTNQDHRSLPEL